MYHQWNMNQESKETEKSRIEMKYEQRNRDCILVIKNNNQENENVINI